MAKVSKKHIEISKSQTIILLVIAGATAITIFSIFATKALIVKGLYQHRVLVARNDVVKQLKDNYDATGKLMTQYKVFADQDPNILGGLADQYGAGNKDGDNPRIVLDSLPSKYDAPALASSIEKVLLLRNVTINSIKVTDDPVGNSDSPQAKPGLKVLPFAFEGTTTYLNVADLMKDLEKSIRPFDVTKLELSGKDNKIKASVQVNTYFLPAKNLDLKPTKEVK